MIFQKKNISKSSHTPFCSLLGTGKPIKYKKKYSEREYGYFGSCMKHKLKKKKGDISNLCWRVLTMRYFGRKGLDGRLLG